MTTNLISAAIDRALDAYKLLADAGLSEYAHKTTGMGHKVRGERFATVVEKVGTGALSIAGVRTCVDMGTL